MESQHNLVTIPPELMEMIACEAEPEDLKQLRLVCHYVRNAIERVHKKAHFPPERAFLLGSKASMDTLFQISGSKDYVSTINKVILCVDALSHCGRPSGLDESDTKIYEFALEQQEVYLGKDEDGYHPTLEASFRNLKFAQKMIKNFAGIDMEVTHQYMTPHNPAKNLFSDWLTPRWYNAGELIDEPEPLDAIASAVCISGLKIRSLEVHGDLLSEERTFSMYIQKAHRTWGPTKWCDINALFHNVSSLHLGGKASLWWTQSNVRSYRRFIRYFSKSPNLEDLSLDVLQSWHFPEELYTDSNREEEIRTLEEEFLRSKFPAVKTLTLRGFQIDCDDLTEFLHRNEKLEALSLEYDCITHTGTFLGTLNSDIYEIDQRLLVETIQARYCGLEVFTYYCRVSSDKAATVPGRDRSDIWGPEGRDDDWYQDESSSDDE